MSEAGLDELRLMLTEYARQTSFDVTIALDELNPLRVHSKTDRQPWLMKTGNGDQHVRNIYRAVMLIERLRYLLDHTPETEWKMFDKLDVNAIIEGISKLNRYQPAQVTINTMVGKCFIEILELMAISGSHFPHYKLHPYLCYFMSFQCEKIYDIYRENFAIYPELLDSIYAAPESKQELLERFITEIARVAKELNLLFVEVMLGLRSSDLNVSVSEYEKKAIKNMVGFYDFFTGLLTDPDHVSVVIKASLEFHEVRKRSRNLIEIKKNAECFSKAIEYLSASLRKSKELNCFVRIVNILKAPKSASWFNECYIVLSFPKDGYPFYYNKYSLALWEKCDDLTLSEIRSNVDMRWSEDYSTIAKCLNISTDNGKDIEALINSIRHAKSKVNKKSNINSTPSFNDVREEFRANQIIIDSLAVMRVVQDTWRKGIRKLKKTLDLKPVTSSAYEVRLQGMTFVGNKLNRSVIYTPAIFSPVKSDTNERQPDKPDKPDKPGKTDKIIKLIDMLKTIRLISLKKAFSLCRIVAINTFQMQSFSKRLNFSEKNKESKEVKLGLQTSDNMLLEMIKTSMVSLYFMKLRLHGNMPPRKEKPHGKENHHRKEKLHLKESPHRKKKPFDEIRISSTDNIKMNYAMAKEKERKTRPSRSAILKIIQLKQLE